MHKVNFKRYFDQDFFEKENKKLFSKLWVFACAVVDFESDDSYVLAKTPFGEIIICKKNNEYHAFYNKCLHRGHPIVNKRKGPLKLVCPYHCWSYSSDGKLKNIPFGEKMYGIKKEQFKKMSLKKIQIIRLGDFIFLNADKNPIKIEKQFNKKIIENLSKTKNMLNKTNCFMSIELDFNWKLIFENLRDSIHPLFLHKNSLNQEVDFYNTLKVKKINKKRIKNIIEISNFSRDGKNKNPPEEYKKKFHSCDDGSSYLNWLLFPYTHIPSPDGGTLFGVENFVPISANKTRLDLHFYITKSKGKTSSIAVFYEWFDKAKIVLKEDLETLISVQKRLKEGQELQNLGDYEIQNIRINDYLNKYVYN